MSNLFIYMLGAGVAESIDRSVPLGERMALGLEVTVLGLGTCIAVLALLWGILEIFRLVFYHPAKNNANSAAEEAPVESVAEDAGSAEDEGELIAAITAAVQCYLDAENAAGATKSSCGFRVVSFKKIDR